MKGVGVARFGGPTPNTDGLGMLGLSKRKQKLMFRRLVNIKMRDLHAAFESISDLIMKKFMHMKECEAAMERYKERAAKALEELRYKKESFKS